MPEVYLVAPRVCALRTHLLLLLFKTCTAQVQVAYHSPSTNLAIQNSPRRGA